MGSPTSLLYNAMAPPSGGKIAIEVKETKMAGPLIRKDAWTLSSATEPWNPNDDTLLWYAKAVGDLSSRPASDPTSWRFQGAIHGYNSATDPFIDAGPVPPQSIQRAFWQQCQHGSWFFLPWHRMYLGFFEQIVRAAVVRLGGPATWTLPYWNYSDPNNGNAKVLPPAFRTPTLPNGSPNPLFVIQGVPIPRAPGINDGDPSVIPDSDVDLSNCLGETIFTPASFGGDPGFGGPRTGFQHPGIAPGALEDTPHNHIHVDVGGEFTAPNGATIDGWMIDPDTAALDPIFWLHHSNIDRLWSVWNGISPANTGPTSALWLKNLAFKFNDATGGVVSMTASQILNTVTSPFAYDYDDTSNPLAAGLEGVEAVAVQPLGTPGTPEMVGASDSTVTLTGAVQSAKFAVAAPAGPAAGLEGVETPRKTYLNIEHVTGERARTTYEVYVNLPDNADAAAYALHFAGALPMFGVSQASVANERHPGTGVNFTLDITALVARLQARNAWDRNAIHVSFAPRPKRGASRGAAVAHSPIRVGRISLYQA